MKSIGHKNNFDHIRLFLALGVFFFHISTLTQVSDFQFIQKIINVTVAVHSFFIVSGFLIFMSYEHSSSLKSYFSKRFNRILPAYLSVVIFFFIFLSLFSSLSIFEFFTSFESWKYLFANLSSLNFLQHSLPGVFTTHINTSVNGALWTIKVELLFYLTVPLIVYSYRWSNTNKVLISIFILSALYYYTMIYLERSTQNSIFSILKYQLPSQMMFFISGAFIYYNLKHFKTYSHIYLLIAIATYTIDSFTPIYPLYAMALSVMIVYLALQIFYLGHISRYGDFSYGVYIWHFPILQIFISLGFFNTHPYITLITLVVTVFIFSFLSWHFIEKIFLKKKSHYILETEK